MTGGFGGAVDGDKGSIKQGMDRAASIAAMQHRPKNCMRARAFDLATNPYLDATMLVVIFANTIVLAYPNYRAACVDAAGRLNTPGCIVQVKLPLLTRLCANAHANHMAFSARHKQ